MFEISAINEGLAAKCLVKDQKPASYHSKKVVKVQRICRKIWLFNAKKIENDSVRPLFDK